MGGAGRRFSQGSKPESPSGKFMLLNRAFAASFGLRRDERTPTHFGSGFQSLLRACDSGRAMQTCVRPPNVVGGLRSLAPDQSASQSRLQGAVGPSSGPCEIVDLDSHHQQRACAKRGGDRTMSTAPVRRRRDPECRRDALPHATAALPYRRGYGASFP
jgi:hypothetical protein